MMEKQELIEEILRLYVWIMDQKTKAKQQAFQYTDIERKREWELSAGCFDSIKAYIEDHFSLLG